MTNISPAQIGDVKDRHTTTTKAKSRHKKSKPVQREDAIVVSPPPRASAMRSKRDRLVGLLLRDEGATVDQMIEATCWLPRTVRAALTGLRKRGYGIDSDKVDGVRTYRAVEPK